MRVVALSTIILTLGGCSSFLPVPRSPGEILSGYNYVPLDPLPVRVMDGANCAPGHDPIPILDALPDNAVRIAVRQLNGSGKLAFGPAQLGYQGNSYQVILDYVNVDVANIQFEIDPDQSGQPTVVKRLSSSEVEAVSRGANRGLINIPVYVGLGLRLTANLTVHKGTVNLASLGSLTAAADAQRISGSLIVQTLGITGPKVVTTLPLPNKLDQTTIENAILSIGAIKALVSDPATVRTVRVTGIYNPIKDATEDTIHRIVSQLADGSKPVEWRLNCSATKRAGA